MAKKVGSVELVSFDAMFTIFRPRKWGRKRLICKIYRDVGEIDDKVTNLQIIKTIAESRFMARGFKTDKDYWLFVNLAVLRALPRTVIARNEYESAPEVHERLIRGDLYEPDPQILRFAKFLRYRGVRVVIASNHRQSILTELLQKHGISDLFEVVYTSEALDTRKPLAEFWHGLLEREQVDAKACVHVGNSPNSDASAALYGIQTLLWDPSGVTARAIKDGTVELHGVEPENLEEFKKMLKNERLVCTVGGAAKAKKAIMPRLKGA